MGWLKKLFGVKAKEVPVEVEESVEEVHEVQEEPEEDLPPILKDYHGEELVCLLCNNEDNETGKYYPIREGDKRKFNGKSFHTKCLRAFKRAGKRGELQ